ISVLASRPLPIIYQTASIGAAFLIFSSPSDFSEPKRSQLWLLRVRRNPEVPHFKRFRIHPYVPPCFLRPVGSPVATPYTVGTERAPPPLPDPLGANWPECRILREPFGIIKQGSAADAPV